uniref:Uncharacterized protein n=1 Tax=viral metagenome TaxID=1070528 RepID=A0A6C0DRR1_9ZZZZ
MDKKLQYTKTLPNNYPTTTPTPLTNNNKIEKYFFLFSNVNTIIIVLLVIISLFLLGINVFNWIGDAMVQLAYFFSYLALKVLTFFGYTSGVFLNKTADVVNDGVKLSSDIADGTVHSIGNILIKSSEENVSDDVKGDLDKLLNNKPIKMINPPPKPDSTTNPVQNSISAKKTKWCFVGEYAGKRGCVEINEDDKCLSGSSFPNKEECMK